MRRPLRDVLAIALVAALLAGCASTQRPPPQEGQVVLQAGSAPPGPSGPAVLPGPEVRQLAILEPGFEPTWQAGWLGVDKKKPGGGGAYSGLITGLIIVQSFPYVMAFWPVALGIVAGTTAMGAFGAQLDTATFAKMTTDDRGTIALAAADLNPDRLLRESATTALAARTGRSPRPLVWLPTYGPDTPGTDPLADARGRGVDGVLNVSLEAFGLAMGEEPDAFGVFVRVRAQLVEPAGGRLRYERVLEHGPGRPLAGLPRPATYTLEFLALDQARVFRHEVREVIDGMARILAKDPALPVGAR